METFIEAKESMIIWNYKDTDPEFGKQAAKELTTHLENCFTYVQVDIIQGRRCLEIVPKQLNNKKVLREILKHANAQKPVDFVMYIGDDGRNEDVFKYLNDMEKSKTSQNISPGSTVLTCTVGRKRTHAKYFFKDTD